MNGEKTSAAGVEGSFTKICGTKGTSSKTTDEVMSTYTKRRCSPQGQHNSAGKRQGNVYNEAQHGDVPGRRADGVDRPFPKKPVSHRRPLNPGKKDSLDLYDFEKITITKQPRGLLSSQEHNSNGIRLPRKDSDRLPSGELQMARAIHAKELMLQEKLWRVEEKIRQQIQRQAVAGDDRKSEEQRHDREEGERGNAQTKTRPSQQQRREPVRRSERMMQERRQEDGRARWKRRDLEVAHSSQSQRKSHKGTHQIAVHEQEVNEEFKKSRWENVKEHTRRKEEDEKDSDIWGETGVKSQDGTEKAQEREQNTTSMGDKGWTRERKYRERTYKEVYDLDDERDMPQMNQQKMSHKETHRGAGRNMSDGPLLPTISCPSHSSRPEQGELGKGDSTDTGLQLLPCRICNRKFASERLQKHVQICKKVKQSHRQVFNSYVNRTKGSAIEEFWKTHSRAKSPEVLRKTKQRQNHKGNTRNLHEGRLPAGTSQPKWSK